jgi:hypothetical protein
MVRKQQKYKSNSKKSKSKLKTIKTIKKKIIKKLNGGGEASVDIFNNLPLQIKTQINNMVSNNLEMEMSVVQIQSRYKTQQQYQLYDFIFDTKTKQLSKIWNHETNNPMSITAGLPGIHIYVVKTDENQNIFEIIGKFTRK